MGDAAPDLPEPLRGELLRRFVAFPRYDALLFPIRALSDVNELARVEVVRISPLDFKLLPVPDAQHDPPTVADKLEGDGVRHFAAFLSRAKRETDYPWADSTPSSGSFHCDRWAAVRRLRSNPACNMRTRLLVLAPR